MRLILMSLLLAVVPAAAFAADGDKACKSDADCGDGGWCVKVPCATMACPPGEECEPVECEPEGYCEKFEPPTWTAGECAADADCPAGFLCKEMEAPCPPMAGCDCAPCPDDGEECPDCKCPEPEPCEPTTVKQCAYEFTECDQDSDCAAGYECHKVEECSGGGSVGCLCAPCDPDGECPPCGCDESEAEPVPEPECKTLGGVCAPKKSKCESNADCQAGWECAEISAGSKGSGTASGGTSTGCVCPPCPEGEECDPCACDDDPTPDSGGSSDVPPPPESDGKADEGDVPVTDDVEKVCLPAGWGKALEEGSFEGGSTKSSSDSAAAEMGLPGSQAQGGADGNASPTPPADPSAGANDGSSSTGSGGSASGCSASPMSSGSGAAFGLGLLLLGLAIRRRR